VRQKKRYVLLKEYPKQEPQNSKFLFQNEAGFAFKTDLKGAEFFRKNALLVSGSVWKLKEYPKLLYSRKPRKKIGMK
jgi:hypothetical protein